MGIRKLGIEARKELESEKLGIERNTNTTLVINSQLFLVKRLTKLIRDFFLHV